MNLPYKAYAWAGIAAVVLFFLKDYFILGLLFSLTLAFFAWAFIDIADKVKNTTLLIGSAATFILYLLGLLLNIFSSFATLPLPIDQTEFQEAINAFVVSQDTSQLMIILAPFLILLVLFLVIIGIIEILWGIGFLKLKDKFGGLATAAGVLEIITGVSFILGFLILPIFIGLLTLLTAFILRIIMLFKADKVIK